jgi:thiol-disulfide isomerase/thioredoxin
MEYSKRAALGDLRTSLGNLGQTLGIGGPNATPPAQNAKTLRTEILDIDGQAIDCWVVELKTNVSAAEVARADVNLFTGLTTAVWIERANGLERQRVTKSIRYDDNSRPVEYEIRTIYRLVNFDEPLPDSLYQFTPPINAKEVDAGFAMSSNLTGKSAPAFQVKSLTGISYSLPELKNRVVFLDFWTSGCLPCRQELPSISKLYGDLKTQGLVVLGINAGEDRQTVEGFLKTAGISYPVALTAGTDIVSDYRINALPTYVVIGKDGVVAAEQIGSRGEEALRILVGKAGLPASTPVAQIEATGRSQSVPDPTRTIRAWMVGSPHTVVTPRPAVPDSIAREAARAGLTIQVQGIPAAGFAERFFAAVDDHEEPELLVMDNFGNIQGITTALGQFPGIASREDIRGNLIQVSNDTFQPGYFYFLVGSARRAEAAKSMILSEQPPCKPEWTGLKPLDSDLNSAAVAGLQAYLATGASLIDDLDRLRTAPSDGIFASAGPSRAARDSLQIRSAHACGYWGNERLAFVPVITVLTSDQPAPPPPRMKTPTFRTMGLQGVLLIFRAVRGEWKMLGASTDPVSSGEFLFEMPQLQDLLAGTQATTGIPLAATLLSPIDGAAPTPPPGGRFGDFVWRPSPSDDVVAEIIEFAYDDNARYFLRFRTKANRDEGQISSVALWTTFSIWRWRVWTISSSGGISLSLSRSFNN